jgi:hypothetical protein
MDDSSEGSEPIATSHSSRNLPKYKPSTPFVLTVSILLGIAVAISGLMGGLGKAFYVTREEYNVQNVQDAKDKTAILQILDRFSKTLDRQDRTLEVQSNAFQKVVDSVQEIKVEMARRGR